MMDTVNDDNLDGYKSYIQRRRVVPEQSGDTSEESRFDTRQREEEPEKSNTDSYDDFFSHDSEYSEKKENSGSSKVYSFTGDERLSNKESSVSALRRADSGLYRRLYGQNRKTPFSSSNTRNGTGYGTSGYRAEIEDNRTTVLAIKIIKQALACFVFLGIIVLMQQRSDTSDAISFIKRHVVDTQIEPKNLLTGVESLVKECTRILGGSP